MACSEKSSGTGSVPNQEEAPDAGPMTPRKKLQTRILYLTDEYSCSSSFKLTDATFVEACADRFSEWVDCLEANPYQCECERFTKQLNCEGSYNVELNPKARCVEPHNKLKACESAARPTTGADASAN